MAVSLGYFESLLSAPGTSTSSELNGDEQAQAGISPGLVRLSVGITGTAEQRWSQLEEAVAAVLDLHVVGGDGSKQGMEGGRDAGRGPSSEQAVGLSPGKDAGGDTAKHVRLSATSAMADA